MWHRKQCQDVSGSHMCVCVVWMDDEEPAGRDRNEIEIRQNTLHLHTPSPDTYAMRVNFCFALLFSATMPDIFRACNLMLLYYDNG